MLDKRCHYKVRECKDFYLFIKYKQSHIYYAKYPAYNKTLSTGQTTLKKAYQEAYRLMSTFSEEKQSFHKLLLDTYKDSSTCTYNVAKKLSEMLSDITDIEQITLPRLVKLQKQLLDTGISGKSVNNYMSMLPKLWKNKEYSPFTNLSPVEHKKVIRKCFPVTSMYHFYSHVSEHKYLLLPFISLSTGMRSGEFDSAEVITKNNRLYLQINGTKTENAVRTVPILKETAICLEEYKKNGFASRAGKNSVIMVGALVGYNEEYIATNSIVFHSFRKMYKTLLESASIPNLWIEYYMGHSIVSSSDVNKLYFQPEAADDTEVYEKVINVLYRLI